MALKRHTAAVVLLMLGMLALLPVHAQHTLGFTVGTGMGTGRFQP